MWSGGPGEGSLMIGMNCADLVNILENLELTKSSSRSWHSWHHPSRPSRNLLPSIQTMLPFLQIALMFLPFWNTILVSLGDRNGWQYGRGWWNAPLRPSRHVKFVSNTVNAYWENPSKIRHDHGIVGTLLPDHPGSFSRPSRPDYR